MTALRDRKVKGRVRTEFSLRVRLGIARIIGSGVGPFMSRGPIGERLSKS